jgi:hypothetical protein
MADRKRRSKDIVGLYFSVRYREFLIWQASHLSRPHNPVISTILISRSATPAKYAASTVDITSVAWPSLPRVWGFLAPFQLRDVPLRTWRILDWKIPEASYPGCSVLSSF